MPMITKYKLNDLAKDLKLPVNDIIDCLAPKYGVKKAGVVLSPEEVNYVLEYFTQKNRWRALTHTSPISPRESR